MNKHVTSFEVPEKTIELDNYGSNHSYQLLPFQGIRLLAPVENQVTKAQVFSEGFKLNETVREEHDDYVVANANLQNPGWDSSYQNEFFYPNHLRTEYGRFHRVISKPHQLAIINFITVDVDFNDEINLQSTKEKIENLSIQPSVIVSSGNGLHIYFAIKHINLINGKICSSVNYDKFTEPSYRKRVTTLKKAISKLLDGDMKHAQNPTALLRVPGSVNYKVKNGIPCVSDCVEIFGSIESSYHNPEYTLEELESHFLTQSDCKNAPFLENPYHEYSPEKRPTPSTEGWIESFSNFCRANGINRPKKYFERYYKFLYGYRNLDHIFELRDSSTLNHVSPRDIKKVRNQFLKKLKAIRIYQKGEPRKRLSTVYQLTEKFFWDSGIERHKNVKVKLSEASYPPKLMRSGVTTDYNYLLKNNVSRNNVREMLKKKILKRNINVKDSLNYLDWLHNKKQ